jgi:hypothetical protein
MSKTGKIFMTVFLVILAIIILAAIALIMGASKIKEQGYSYGISADGDFAAAPSAATGIYYEESGAGKVAYGEIARNEASAVPDA